MRFLRRRFLCLCLFIIFRRRFIVDSSRVSTNKGSLMIGTCIRISGAKTLRKVKSIEG